MKALWLMASCLICATPLAASAAEAEINPDTNTARTSADSNPAVAAAHAISTITGVAISPLLGVSAVGAWKYFRTPSAQRAQLPWFAQPYFWGPALALIVAVFIKDALGTAMPTVLKKPFDVLEVFENKLSALIAAGAFVPLVASIFHSVSSGDSSAVAGMRLAMIDFWPLLNAVAVSVAVLIFLIVWMVAHVINVLIVLSPWGIVDAGLKLARLFVLYTLTAAAFLNVYLGAALSILIILICCFLVGWAFRMTVFGAIFAWDLFTMQQTRFKPAPLSNWMFTARKIEKAPVRTYGKLRRDEHGQLVLSYRPWLVLRPRLLVLPPGQYAVGRGLLYPEIFRTENSQRETMLDLAPRYRTHEHELAAIYSLPQVCDVGAIKSFKAAIRWLKELLGFGTLNAVTTERH